MSELLLSVEDPAIGFLHQIGRQMAAADPFHEVLGKIVEFVSAVVKCDSCFVYVLENKQLVLRASKNPHPEVVNRLKLPVGQGITGWVAEHRQPVAVASHAFKDPRFQSFNELPEDHYEAFLSVPILCRKKLVGVINLQHKQPHTHIGERNSAHFDDWFFGGRGSRASAVGGRELATIRRAGVAENYRAWEGDFAARFADQRGGSLPDAAEAEPPAAAVDAGSRGSDYFERRDQAGAGEGTDGLVFVFFLFVRFDLFLHAAM